MTIDDSFKKPGAIPFKWEIQPGVPKIQLQQLKKSKQLSPPILPSPSPPFTPRGPSPLRSSSFSTKQPQQKPKLKPPPGGFIYFSPEPRTGGSFRSTPRPRSERWKFDQPARLSPQCVSQGCFPSPLLKKKPSKRWTSSRIPETESEPDYMSDLDSLGRWSVSSRKSCSQFYDSSMSSYSSSDSSPRPVRDAEWAGFGLF